MSSMIDQDFDDENDENFVEVPEKKSPAEKQGKEELEIEIVDDTPEKDRGKWKAGDDDDKDNKKSDDDDDDIKSYSERVQKRIARETAKGHAERRAREERDRQLNELAEFSKRIIAENNQLKGLVENGEKVLVTEHTGRLESQLAAAKIAYKEAIEAADVTGQVEAQTNIAKIAAAMEQASRHQARPMPRTADTEIDRYVTPQRAAGPDEAAMQWKERNKWFGKDEQMTATAMGVHQHVVSREGISPNDPEYYKRIDQEMRKRYPERFEAEGNGQTVRRQPPVGAVTRTGGRTVRRVTLSETQAKLARRLGLTPEQYAEQLVAENGAKEFTHG